jgi:glutathione peroxidase
MTHTKSVSLTTRPLARVYSGVIVGALLSLSCAKGGASSEPTQAAAVNAPVDVVIKDIDGKDLSLRSLRGKAVLVVNTASECGYTPQYAGLEKLHRAYKDKGLVVLAVPSNDFGGQEPGSNEDIKEFTAEKFEVTFPLMDKVHASGDEISPLYKTLTESGPETTRGPVRWNFTKFLLDTDGKIVTRFESKVDPMSSDVKAAIERVLPKS